MTILQPVDPNKRIEILDILRGFAILGILFANVRFFSGHSFMPFEQLKLFPTYAFDARLSDVFRMVISSKFYTLFSILFAVGFFLQFSKNQNDPKVFLKTYRRRLLILWVIGLVHSLIWFGDILLTYSIVGFLLIFFRNKPPKKLLMWSLILIFFFIAGDLILMPITRASNAFPQSSTESLAHTQYPDMTPEEVMVQFKEGSIQEQFALNIHHIVWKYLAQFSSGRFFTILGLFLLGYYLASIDFFKEKIKSIKLLILSGLVGFTALFLSKWVGGSMYYFPPTFSNILYKILFTISQILICFFYITAVAKLTETKWGHSFFCILKPVGRMALTNYLTQTLICIILFYNFGLDLVSELGFGYITFIVLCILIVQIIYSNIWMRYFRFGPMEWLLRSLTYKKPIQIKV